MTGLALLLVLGLAPNAPAILIFSTGMKVPESISQVPDGFGSLGGSYLIPDPQATTIWDVPSIGGTPSVFASDPNLTFRGGLFLPSGWGAYGGMYMAVGESHVPVNGVVNIYDASGATTQLVGPITQFTSAALAPATFGTLGGQAFITSQTGVVIELNQSGVFSTFATTSIDFSFRPFGITFAPVGWGAVGGEMLVSNGVDGRIDAIDPLGNVSLFATLPDKGFGLRQMAFCPPGFLAGYGSLLFVSVSGSGNGGGSLGDVYAVDSNGTVVESLRTDLGLTKFDPRGLLFRADGNLLLSDASDPVYLVSPSDFRTLVPEPNSLAVFAVGFALIGSVFVRRRYVDRSAPETDRFSS
jgi:hypothetical protein